MSPDLLNTSNHRRLATLARSTFVEESVPAVHKNNIHNIHLVQMYCSAEQLRISEHDNPQRGSFQTMSDVCFVGSVLNTGDILRLVFSIFPQSVQRTSCCKREEGYRPREYNRQASSGLQVQSVVSLFSYSMLVYIQTVIFGNIPRTNLGRIAGERIESPTITQ